MIISDSLEGFSRIGEKKTGAAGSRSSGSAGSRNPDAGATLSSLAHDEEEEEEDVIQYECVRIFKGHHSGISWDQNRF